MKPAASLAIVEAEVYDHPGFRRQLRDAAASLAVGPSWSFDATITPVMTEPGEALRRALTTLDPGEEWLLEPRMVDGNPCLWSPGIKLGVTGTSWFRRTECFGPVLGIIRADHLSHAIQIQNDSEFGLTGGIHSLDDREIARWKDEVEVGNAYINRSITGAIVQRQPFGGWKHSCFGPGAKAGGPDHVAQFGVWRNEALPRMITAPSAAVVEMLGKLEVRLPDAMDLLTATAMGVPFSLSLDAKRDWLDGLGVKLRVESGAGLIATFVAIAGSFEFIRSPRGPVDLKTAAIAAGMRWADAPVVWNARLEWPVWFREQAVSETLHRYGNIIAKPEYA